MVVSKQPDEGQPKTTALPIDRRALFVTLSLALIVFLAFFRVLNNGFLTYDDATYVTGNDHIRNGLKWSNVKWAFETFWASNWHPLTWLSHMLDCQIFGLEPWGHHLTNLLFHGLNTILVFYVLRTTSGAIWQSAFVAALFGVHPLHVESVSWVAERKDLLSTTFWILSLLAYTGFTGQSTTHPGNRRFFYVLALILLALGLMSKPMLVTAPLVMLLLDYWPLRRFEQENFSRLLFEKIPFFLLSGISVVISIQAQNSGGALASAIGVPLDFRVENALVSYVLYLGKLFCPVDLAIIYPYPKELPFAEVLLCGFILFGISAFVLAQRRERPFLFTGWLWFLVTLIPVIGIVQIGPQAMADRYTYVPAIGIFIAVTWWVVDLTRSLRIRPIALAGCALAIVAVGTGMTIRQTGLWKNNETLFRHAIAVTRGNGLAYSNLADYELNEGHVENAIELYNEAIRLQPEFSEIYDKLGVALCREGRIDNGVNEFRAALQMDPVTPLIHEHLAQAMEETGHTNEAIAQYKEIVRLTPGDPKARTRLGIALQKNGQIEGALEQYHLAVQLAPDLAGMHYNLALGLEGNGSVGEACGQLEECLKLDPGYAEAHNELGTLLGSQGRLDEAVFQFREAIRLKPDYTNASINLSLALKMKESLHEN